MPGDPRECRQRAVRCLELASQTANESVKHTLLSIAKHWQALAEELERAKMILDDEKGGLKIAAGKKRKVPRKSAVHAARGKNSTSRRRKKKAALYPAARAKGAATRNFRALLQ